MVNDLPCCGFADGAGDCDNLEFTILTIPAGEVAEGLDGIGDFENNFVGEFIGLYVFTDNGSRCAFCEDISEEVVAIEVWARYGKKAVTWLYGS